MTAPYVGWAAEKEESSGAVVGEPTAAKVGQQVLADGGNAVDAIVAAALVASVVAPHHCGVGGYGGAFMIAPAAGTLDCRDRFQYHGAQGPASGQLQARI